MEGREDEKFRYARVNSYGLLVFTFGVRADRERKKGTVEQRGVRQRVYLTQTTGRGV